MKTTNKMKKRILAFGSIATLLILIIAFSLFIFKNKNLSPNQSAVKAYNYLKDNSDLSSTQIIGIVSNIKAQSNFDTTIHENSDNSIGLMCWSHYRADKLDNFANKKHKDVDDFYLQLDFILDEISENSSNFQLSDYNGYTIEDWNSVKNPVDAALIFESLYVRPAIFNSELEDIAITYAESL